MKSGEVLTDKRWKWYEPEHWRFGDPAGKDGKINYLRHASGGCATGRVVGWPLGAWEWCRVGWVVRQQLNWTAWCVELPAPRQRRVAAQMWGQASLRPPDFWVAGEGSRCMHSLAPCPPPLHRSLQARFTAWRGPWRATSPATRPFCTATPMKTWRWAPGW